MKNYERALYFFEVCISTPAMAMSYIMLEAYKKFILVSLILHGKVRNYNLNVMWHLYILNKLQIQPIPKYASQVISRFMKPIAQVYHNLAVAYATTSSEEVRNCISKYSETFVRDNNMGLAKQVRSCEFLVYTQFDKFLSNRLPLRCIRKTYRDLQRHFWHYPWLMLLVVSNCHQQLLLKSIFSTWYT